MTKFSYSSLINKENLYLDILFINKLTRLELIIITIIQFNFKKIIL